ncbi:toll-like receptor 13 isoform X1 [Octopus bimaculoides]|uniref:TIR domain-containing protein n=1 Tax=Octopus bimaculoides TaxID=37653 RepID=A0A0L8IEY2_OCTBM|nr:toll-like receptor 13 isoform X1 [Octopus bimaculoides]XP_014771070.1 toll-like receptor 13 isoform X1 [Octopus bimaculoides]XP_052822127.1 toll-like receptor 13 isoform X1 [Octopus bimaculoides]|eukprot:XP_014771062.1 PREDICTED: toll-like receptor 13 [Octopus bimaculoides]
MNSLSLSVLFLIIHVSYGEAKECHVLRKGRWSCEGSTFVPTFPQDTTSITFTDLTVNNWDNQTFQNLTELPLLEHLLIKTTFLKTSTNDVFTYLKYIQEFAIVNLQLPLPELRNVLFGLPLTTKKLVFAEMKFETLNKDIFDGLRGTNISSIYIRVSTMLRFDGSYFNGIDKLDQLTLQGDSITSVTSWGYLPNLTYLDFYYNEISTLPKFINESGFIFYPKLEKLFLCLSRFSYLNSNFFKGLDRLHTLGIYVGDIFLVKSDVFQELKCLRAVSLLSHKHHILRFEQNVFKLKLLESVELNNIHVDINEGKPSAIFKSCPQLTNLILKNVSNIYPNDLLKPLTKLENLMITDGQVSKVPDTICNMNNLTELSIFYTTVSKWNNANCSVMRVLRKLVLKDNKIIYVNPKLFSHLLFSNEKLHIDLSRNPFVCDCKALWFRDWSRKNAGRLKNYRNYRCFSPNSLGHIHLRNFSLSWDYCENINKPSSIAIAGVSVGVLAVMFVFLAILSYTKRWSIRFCIYQSLVRKRKYKALVNNGRYKYDAFICYCSTDVSWVLNKLLPIIEEENHFNLCLHDRDFLVGNDIVDNIVDSMQQSRKVVLVLSNDFAQSSWCQFEASIAQQKILEEHYDIIIPVLLNEIPSNLQTKRLGVLLKQKTYLEWPNDEQYEGMFWERFIGRLNANDIDNEI